MFNYNTPSPSYQKPSTTLLVIRLERIYPMITMVLTRILTGNNNNNNNTPHVSKMASFLQHLDLLPETSQKATAKYDDSTSRE
ncbi:hypothetical protein CBS63078_1965 [Aspergillus niger]|nr:hypothetical protein CBS13152_566 [Aspergillus niger]KAI2927860.1 hypothetical protein CBS63078_1965 [Aspergillus niger]KAI2970932.1 hypothetical protein CBS147323_3156 [Aspergillus niger]KAI3030451.1 hypothetical protein CBS147345_1772 [Aspergillus niger]KAI3032213.1 hypothetical protein CBS147347_1383 [Aspergillus niger]